MPTKSGRIKLEDLRQGKTIWLPHINDGELPWYPQPCLVVEGVHKRWAGFTTLNLLDVMGGHADPQYESYSLPAFAYSWTYGTESQNLSGVKNMMLSFFAPARNPRVETLPDGSLAHSAMFATRGACQRHCDAMNRGDA